MTLTQCATISNRIARGTHLPHVALCHRWMNVNFYSLTVKVVHATKTILHCQRVTMQNGFCDRVLACDKGLGSILRTHAHVLYASKHKLRRRIYHHSRGGTAALKDQHKQWQWCCISTWVKLWETLYLRGAIHWAHLLLLRFFFFLSHWTCQRSKACVTKPACTLQVSIRHLLYNCFWYNHVCCILKLGTYQRGIQ